MVYKWGIQNEKEEKLSRSVECKERKFHRSRQLVQGYRISCFQLLDRKCHQFELELHRQEVDNGLHRRCSRELRYKVNRHRRNVQSYRECKGLHIFDHCRLNRKRSKLQKLDRKNHQIRLKLNNR